MESQYTTLKNEYNKLNGKYKKQKQDAHQLKLIKSKYKQLMSECVYLGAKQQPPPKRKRQKTVSKNIKLILFRHYDYAYGYDELCCLFDELLKCVGMNTYKESDCLHIVEAVHDYFDRIGTGKGANKLKLKGMPTVAAAIMRLDGYELLNRKLFEWTKPELNVLPQKNRGQRKAFLDGCVYRRRRFDRGDSHILCKEYKDERRTSSEIFMILV